MEHRGNLNARDDAYVPKVYSKRLDELIADPDIKNIAITAPYDSGKTTILRSYFKQRKDSYKWWIWHKNWWISKINILKQKIFFSPNLTSPIQDYEFINIPNFFEVSVNKNKKSNKYRKDLKTEVQLEKSIIEQLLYKANTSRYPDSNLSRLRTHNLFSISMQFIYFVFLFSYLIRILGDKSNLKWWNSLPIWDNQIFQIISFVIILIGSFKLFVSLTHAFGKVKLHAATKMGPLEIAGETEAKNSYSIDLFNYYGDELQYYFNRNNIRIVIFEDLDRFNSPLIFQKLRELNSNLNKSGNNITFIYSLKDKVFATKNSEINPAELKTKFFDAIIPIFPIHSYRDSSQTFLDESEQYDLVNQDDKHEEDDYFKQRDAELSIKKAMNIKINYKYLKGLGLYVSDTREIKNIISETYFYFMELPLKIFDPKNGGTPIAIDKLFAMVVYKNELPEDFDKLASGDKSKLEGFINSISEFKSSLLNIETENNNEQISKLNSKIEDLRSELTTDVSVLMQIRFQELINKNYERDIQVGGNTYSRTSTIGEIHDFWKEVLKENLKYKDSYSNQYRNVDNLKQNEEEIFKLYSFKNMTSNDILLQWKKSKEKLENENAQLQKNISSLRIKDLLINYLNNKDLLSDKLSKNVKKGIKFITSNQALEYLVKQGLIDFDYTDYISPDPYNNLLPVEEDFIRDVINHRNISRSDYRLPRVERVIREISLLDDSVNTFKYAYSPDVLAYFTNERNKSEYLETLIDSSLRKHQSNFILSAINALNGENINLTRLFHSIFKTWPNYYEDVFLSSDNEWKRDLSRQLLNYLSSENPSDELFDSLEKQKIFENNVFEKEFLFLNNGKINKILESKNIYHYPDLAFVANYSLEKLSQFVSNKWFAENKENFKVIFDAFAKHNLNTFLNNFKNELNLSDDFIKSFVFKYYSTEKNATYEDLVSLVRFIQNSSQNDAANSSLKILDVYLKTKNDFNYQEKRSLLIDNLHLVELIDKKQFKNTKLLEQLLENNRLIYDKQFFDGLYKNYQNFAKQYALRFESEKNIGDFYHDKAWNFVLSYLENTKFVNNWVKMIDKDADSTKPNTGWTQEKISPKAFKLLANNTLSVNVMKSLMSLTKDSDDKTVILKNIFHKPKFEHQFTKQEISNLLFKDPEVIVHWPINGRSEIPTAKLNQQDRIELEQLYKNVPSDFKKKGSKGFIFLTKFNRWFKDNR